MDKTIGEPPKLSDSLVLKTISDHSTDSIYFKDKVGRYIYVNRQIARENAFDDPQEMIGTTNYDYFTQEAADRIAAQEKQIMATGISLDGVISKMVRYNGQLEWRLSTKSPLYDDNGQIIGVWAISRNVTEAETAKEAVAFNQVKFKLMLESISDIIEIMDAQAIIKYVSPNIHKEFGWSAEEAIGKSGFDLIHPDDRKQAQRSFKKLSADANVEIFEEIRVVCKNGNYKHVDLCGKNLLHDPYIQGILINYHDISSRKKQEEKISYLSVHDSMTGLYNRFFFEVEKRRLDTDRQIPFSIIMGDVNLLKMTNDTYGHAEGDRLLIAVAKILLKCCRKEDIVARVGGDEYCILLPQTGLAGVNAICARIDKACQEYKSENGRREFHPSISLGFATKTEPGQSLDGILKEAEEMMYRRKRIEHELIKNATPDLVDQIPTEVINPVEEDSDKMIGLMIQLGSALGLNDDQLLELDALSRLYNIGQVSIDDSIMEKPGKLTDEEWIKVKQHPEAGFKIAQASIELVRISRMILSHHERWDGAGYPDGLAGEEIPLLSRIISVIDAYTAMTQDRPYRKAMAKDAAINEIVENASTQFDPEVAKVFVTKVLGESWERP